jgi:hypothetical protein
MASTDVAERLRDVALECIRQWNQKQSADCDAVVFRTRFLEGQLKEGVTKQMFDHMLLTVSRMTCWDPSEASQPWKYVVEYDVALDALERDVAEWAKTKRTVKSTVECDAKGNNAVLRLSYTEQPQLLVGIGPFATIQVSLEKQCDSGQYLKKDTHFSKIVVEARKTFTFSEHFDWEYTFVLRFREPYVETSDLMEDLDAKDLTFRDPPRCFVELSCRGTKATLDHAYFADSFLCKVSDLLPGAWQMAPFHVRSSSSSSSSPPRQPASAHLRRPG